MRKTMKISSRFVLLLSFLMAGVTAAQTPQPFVSLTVMEPGKMLADIETLSAEVKNPIPADMILQKITDIFPLDTSTIDMSRPLSLLLKDPMSLNAGLDKAIVLIFSSTNMERTLASLGGKSALAGEETDIYEIFPEEGEGGERLYLRKTAKLAVLGGDMLTLKGMEPAGFLEAPAGLKGNVILRLSLEPVRPMIAMMLPMSKQQAINEAKAAMEQEGKSEEEMSQALSVIESGFGFAEEFVAAMKELDVALDVGGSYLSAQVLMHLNSGNMISDLAALNAKKNIMPYMSYIETAAPIIYAMNVELTPRLRDMYFDIIGTSLMPALMPAAQAGELPEGMDASYGKFVKTVMKDFMAMKEMLTAFSYGASMSLKDGKPYFYEVVGGVSDFDAYRNLMQGMLTRFNQDFDLDFLSFERDLKKIRDISVDRISVNMSDMIQQLSELEARAESAETEKEEEEAASEAVEADAGTIETAESPEGLEEEDIEEITALLSGLFGGDRVDLFTGYGKDLAYFVISPNGMAEMEKMVRGEVSGKSPDLKTLFGPLDQNSQVFIRFDIGEILQQINSVALNFMPGEDLEDLSKAAALFKGLPPVFAGKKFSAESIRGDIHIPRGILAALSEDDETEESE